MDAPFVSLLKPASRIATAAMKAAIESAVAVMVVVNRLPHQESARSASRPRVQGGWATPPPSPPAGLGLFRLRLGKRLPGLLSGNPPGIPLRPDPLRMGIRAFPSSPEQLISKPTEHISTSSQNE